VGRQPRVAVRRAHQRRYASLTHIGVSCTSLTHIGVSCTSLTHIDVSCIGLSHAIVADGDAALRMKSCTVHGVVQATDAAWQGIRNGTNQLVEPDEPTQLPPEEGCFKFEADRFTRKQ
jgi:hypothetical protein